jgi:DNA-binding GntR family transcriptional regulator
VYQAEREALVKTILGVTRNRQDELVELVRNRILAGTAAPGLPIRQDALAAELGVSKIPLREALTRLEQEGLIRSEANRGFFVRSLSAAEAEEVYDLRLKLEPEAVALAAARADDNERRIAGETLEALDRVTNTHGEGVGAFNRAFHLALIRPCRRPITTLFLERLQILSERYVRKHLEPMGRDERANEEHRELLERWMDRDGTAVAGLMRAHIYQTLEDLRLQLPDNA